MIERLVEGWTFPLDFELQKNGAPFTEEELQGSTVTLVLKDKEGVVVDTANKVSWINTSVARFTPDSRDLLPANSPYTVHWSINVDGRVILVPKGEPDRWIVSKA